MSVALDGGSADAAPDRRGRRRLRILLALLLAFWLLRLGASPLFDVDEGAFAEASREMLASSDWGHTTLNGGDRFDKPILVYWLQAASLAVFGVNEFAARLPSALCAFGWCLTLGAFAWRRFGAGVAASAVLMLATCVGVLLIGRAATADALLNLLIALSMFDLWRFVESRHRKRLVRAFAWVGLGLLAKGPVAFLIPAAVIAVWALVRRDWHEQGPLLRRAALDPLAWAALLLIAVPWYAYALQRHGQAFVDGFLFRHNLGRFNGALEGHGGSVFYYLLVLPLLMLPWSALLVPVLRGWRQRWGDPLDRFLLVWAGFVLGFFSLSGTKLPHYMLYGLTPLILLAARELQRCSMPIRVALVGAQALLLGVGAASPPLARMIGARSADDLVDALTGGAQSALLPASAAVLALVLAAVWFGGRALPRLALSPLAGVQVGGALVAAWLVGVVVPWWGDLLQGPVRRAAQQVLAFQAGAEGRPGPAATTRDSATPTVDAVMWHLNQPSFAFYLARPTPRRDPVAGDLALTRLDRIDPMQLNCGDVRLVFAERGYAVFQIQGADHGR
jgi:4-amino-4-deoxy-L-arabinose transferase-like glycosyltransferase